ncbi:MAG: ABC transporter ATP-binding protein/permease [Caldilinea sp.]|nr:ABC transporter ATP-binding protein/permease [Caldilinea sp.]
MDEGHVASRSLHTATAAGFVAGAMLVAQAWLLSLVVDGVFLRGQVLADMLPLLGVMLACLLVRSAAIYAETVLAQRSSSRTKQALRQALTTRLIAIGPIALRGERTGELVSTAGEGVEALDAYITQYRPARSLSFLLPTFILLVVLILDPWTSLVLLFAAPMLILMLAFIGGRAKTLTERRFLELRWMSAFFLDLLQGLTTLKLFGRSQEQAETIEEVSRQYGKTTMEVLATAFQSSLVMEWAATAATALVALEVSYRLMGGSLAFAPALAVLLLTPEFFLPLRTLAIRYHAGAAGKAALDQIDVILRSDNNLTQRREVAEVRREGARGEGRGRVGTQTQDPTQRRGDAEERREETAESTQRRRDAKTQRKEELLSSSVSHTSSASAQLCAFAPMRQSDSPLEILFDNVRYSYGERMALRGCSFTLAPGQRTALVGATGAGKSTVASLLLRFLEPDAGEIQVGDVPLVAIDPETWRELVAWVPQQPYLFAGAVRDNLRLARPDATDEQIVDAAHAANAHDFIAALPQGYATPIGEQGMRLSGGQRQRLAIARALLKDAPLLILDEPTAHLDAENERLIRAALERLLHGRTALIIAHRLEMALTADQVIVLDEGAVVQQGAPAALRATAGPFRDLLASYEAAQ